MITKIFAITLIMISTTLLGMSFADCMSTREKELRNLADAIGLMSDQLDYTLEPVKFLFKKVLFAAKGSSGILFEKISENVDSGKTASEAWKSAIENCKMTMCLSKKDYDILIGSSDSFCATELEQQKSLLKGLQSRIVALADNAFEFNRKNNRLARAIGIYGGIFICAVLF